MTAQVAIIAPGNMGAAIARRLTQRGARVLTTLAGRGAASRDRAMEAAMIDVPAEQLGEADFVLSIVPPAAAVSVADDMTRLFAPLSRKPVFVDCNAVSPATSQRIAAVVQARGIPFVDASIIGVSSDPTPTGPHIYVCGEHAHRLRTLASHGLDVRVLDAPNGAASALKMSFAGISKGTIAVATAMILAATRAGAAGALLQELSESERTLLATLARRIPGMFPKAYRWVAEMQEIAEFASTDAAAHEIFIGASHLYERIAQDLAGDRVETDTLARFFTREAALGRGATRGTER